MVEHCGHVLEVLSGEDVRGSDGLPGRILKTYW